MKNFSKFRFLLFALIPFVFSSCYEVREELTLKADGSGSYGFYIDMSQNASMLDGMKALSESVPDSLKGEKDKGKNVVQAGNNLKMDEQAKLIEEVEGITNAKDDSDDKAYIYGMRFDFKDLKSLNNAMEALSREKEDLKTKVFENGFQIYEMKGRNLVRNWSDKFFVSKTLMTGMKDVMQEDAKNGDDSDSGSESLQEQIEQSADMFMESMSYSFELRTEGQSVKKVIRNEQMQTAGKNTAKLKLMMKDIMDAESKHPDFFGFELKIK